jgi:hypothetical protein
MLASLRKALIGTALVTVFIATAGAQSLTPGEEARAVALASPTGGAIETASALHPASSRAGANRVVVSSVEGVSTETSRRLAVVTLYQYEGNVTIDRLVDLDTGTVVNERSAQGVGAPVADVEADYARSLLMADNRITQLLAPFGGEASLSVRLASYNRDPSDPLYGKRVVDALISTPDGYVTGVQIHVNLSDATVIIDR